MRQCPKCRARNRDANRYCSHCGTSLVPEPPRQRHPGADPEKSARLLDLAFQLSDEGRLSDAIQVAQQAVLANPGSTSAHSLLGILYERAGQREQAMREYERALELSPDSVADRGSLEQLKATRSGVGTGPAPRGVQYTVVGLFSLVVLLVVLGIFHTLQGSGTRQGRAPATAQVGSYDKPQPLPLGQSRVQPYRPLMPIQPAAEQEPAPPQPTALPAPAPSAPKRTLHLTPVSVPTQAAPQPEQPPVLQVDRPKVVTPASLAQAETESAGIGVDTARRLCLAKSYPNAIQAYQRVLAADPNAPAYVHEELAWCYHQAGQVSEAKAEYRRALEAYLRELAKGENMAEATHGMSTCEAALRALENN